MGRIQRKSEETAIFITQITKENVFGVFSHVKDSAPGQDGIVMSQLKRIAQSNSDIVIRLINESFSRGVFFDDLKIARIVLFYKKGNIDSVGKYRPISLINSFSKLIEQILKGILIKFVDQTKFFSSNQYGFRKGQGTERSLMKFTKQVYTEINAGNKTIAVFLDIKKGFDSVDHKILLEKLYTAGVRGNIYSWFKSYLTMRKQFVKIETSTSRFGTILSGEPQGSVIGPILFLIYINDLCDLEIDGQIFAYADDTAVVFPGSQKKLYLIRQRRV